ncbi:hypothetical protein DFJ73DRAFT_902345 [Zopfochytrium polystomum]|nr:hypothetical protein DFJ73DRAFT_902345 [Zopfochytrium polystomum]
MTGWWWWARRSTSSRYGQQQQQQQQQQLATLRRPHLRQLPSPPVPPTAEPPAAFRSVRYPHRLHRYTAQPHHPQYTRASPQFVGPSMTSALTPIPSMLLASASASASASTSSLHLHSALGGRTGRVWLDHPSVSHHNILNHLRTQLLLQRLSFVARSGPRRFLAETSPNTLYRFCRQYVEMRLGRLGSAATTANSMFGARGRNSVFVATSEFADRIPPRSLHRRASPKWQRFNDRGEQDPSSSQENRVSRFEAIAATTVGAISAHLFLQWYGSGSTNAGNVTGSNTANITTTTTTTTAAAAAATGTAASSLPIGIGLEATAAIAAPASTSSELSNELKFPAALSPAKQWVAPASTVHPFYSRGSNALWLEPQPWGSLVVDVGKSTNQTFSTSGSSFRKRPRRHARFSRRSPRTKVQLSYKHRGASRASTTPETSKPIEGFAVVDESPDKSLTPTPSEPVSAYGSTPAPPTRKDSGLSTDTQIAEPEVSPDSTKATANPPTPPVRTSVPPAAASILHTIRPRPSASPRSASPPTPTASSREPLARIMALFRDVTHEHDARAALTLALTHVLAASAKPQPETRKGAWVSTEATQPPPSSSSPSYPSQSAAADHAAAAAASALRILESVASVDAPGPRHLKAVAAYNAAVLLCTPQGPGAAAGRTGLGGGTRAEPCPRARRWIEAAAAAGHERAMGWLGALLVREGRAAEGSAWLARADAAAAAKASCGPRAARSSYPLAAGPGSRAREAHTAAAACAP